ncbi:MAG: LuxR C-terminal-related transcriptional regulator [Actinomycetes bacterium]
MAAESASIEQRAAVTSAPLPMVLVELASRRILEISDALVDLAGAQRDQMLGGDATRYLSGGPSPALPLLASGQIDGYEATRWLRYPDGREAQVHVWAHAFDDERPPQTAVFVIDELEGADRPGWTGPATGAVVLGGVDLDWRIDRISADVQELLGFPADAVVGMPFLGAVNPGDIADLLIGLGHAERTGETVIMRMRLRGADGGWRWCRAWIAATGESPAFTFMLREVVSDVATADLAQQLRERLARIAYEAHAATTLATTAALPPATQMPGLARLTTREWEIVSALQRGARASDVARTLNLAPSTVRNHLSAVYRKLGVNSQVELLAALNRSQVANPE